MKKTEHLPSAATIRELAKKHCSRRRGGLSFCLGDLGSAPVPPKMRCDACSYAAELIAESRAANKKENPAATAGQIARAKVSYRVGHWGKGGSQKPRMLACADPVKDGPVVVIGRLIALEYETDKFGDGMSVYVHKVTSRDATIAHTRDGRLVIGGEKIKMTVRGIVG